MLRYFLLVTALLALLLTAAVYEAVAGAREALALLRASPAIEQASLREDILARAADRIERSWAGAPQWHAGAAEALSAVYAARAAAAPGDTHFAVKSMAAAQRAVELSPVQPRAWTRLAAFAQLGLAAPCSVAECLARSWRAGRIIDPQSACTRLRIAAAEGLLTGAEDERITWYLHSGPRVRDAARCLDFLPSEARFRRVLEAR